MGGWKGTADDVRGRRVRARRAKCSEGSHGMGDDDEGGWDVRRRGREILQYSVCFVFVLFRTNADGNSSRLIFFFKKRGGGC